MAWSGFSQAHLVQKQVGVQESSGPVSGRMQPAHYQFPAFRLGCGLPQMAPIILCKISPDPIWFWLTGHVLVKLIRFGSKPVCKNHPAHFCPLQADRIQHLYWVGMVVLFVVIVLKRPSLRVSTIRVVLKNGSLIQIVTTMALVWSV